MRWTSSAGLQRAINVWVDADRLAAYQLPITAVRDAVVRQNANTPGGNVTTGQREQTLRTMGRLTDAEAFDESGDCNAGRLADPRCATLAGRKTAPKSNARWRGSTASPMLPWT